MPARKPHRCLNKQLLIASCCLFHHAREGPYLAALSLTLALTACQSAAATGEGTYSIHEYPLPSGAAEIGAMAVDGAGNIWLIQNDPPVLYKLVRENGTFSNYTLDGFKYAGFAGMSVDEAGLVWFADPDGQPVRGLQ